MALTEKQVREKILTGIWEVCPDSKKIPRNPLTGDRTKWKGLITHKVENVSVEHGWIVRRVGKREAVKDTFERWTFQLLGFYGHNPGTGAENSEDKFQAIVDKVLLKLADKDIENPLWEFEGENDEVSTEEVDSTITLMDACSLLHFCDGRLVVNIERC